MTADQVELNWMRAPESASSAAALFVLLSKEERQRVRQFRRDSDQYRYVAARACLRMALSELLAIPPSEIPIRRGALGAPTLGDGLAGPAFSVSHAGAWAVVAVGHVLALGVDVEALPSAKIEGRPTDWNPELLARSASGCERDVLYWVGKEAILKALGCGVAVDPDRIGIALRGDGRIDIHRLPHEIPCVAGLRALLVRAPPGYAAAIALIVDGRACQPVVTERWRSGSGAEFPEFAEGAGS